MTVLGIVVGTSITVAARRAGLRHLARRARHYRLVAPPAARNLPVTAAAAHAAMTGLGRSGLTIHRLSTGAGATSVVASVVDRRPDELIRLVASSLRVIATPCPPPVTRRPAFIRIGRAGAARVVDAGAVPRVVGAGDPGPGALGAWLDGMLSPAPAGTVVSAGIVRRRTGGCSLTVVAGAEDPATAEVLLSGVGHHLPTPGINLSVGPPHDRKAAVMLATVVILAGAADGLRALAAGHTASIWPAARHGLIPAGVLLAVTVVGLIRIDEPHRRASLAAGVLREPRLFVRQRHGPVAASHLAALLTPPAEPIAVAHGGVLPDGAARSGAAGRPGGPDGTDHAHSPESGGRCLA